ncbi:MAG: hypothetical protein A2570_00455 [Candidatus Brennerbacteria bacterium RIFOXYD1_FULL_41_16]|uniref:Uncharacterized protein n=1 Tax=Candidatus Brennerbacteria bacterium RIFOXYD1_FULL_41_16 TaxID=1797529 RepID=A0A1G1XLW2_9BACT|nr:MAG: hypothetical protein A2570_00455 [Candidatus Brennerbacteria bacterium RIFOXYD1_FULL_41_16]
MDLLEQIKSLHWGMTKSDYQKFFADKNWQPEHPTDNAVIFGDTYLEYPVSITAYFFDGTDKLGRLALGYSNLPDNKLKEVYPKIISGLTKNYGAPQFSETPENDPATPAEFRISEMKTWKTANSVITSTFVLAESGATIPGIGVVWGDIENDPASRRWGKSELSDGRKPEKLPKDFKFSEAQIEEIKRAMENDKGN